MADPVSIGLGVAGVAAGLYSDSKNRKAAKEQNQIQNALNARSQALAEKMNQQGMATQVDANGNITYYDEGTNTWRTVLAEQQKQINDASNLELLRSLSIDAPMARGEALRNSQTRMLEASSAGSLRDQMDNKIAGKGNTTPGQIASSLRLSRNAAVDHAFDDTQTALTTQALRTGTGVSGIGAGLAKSRAAALAQIMGNPELEGMQASRDFNATDLSNSINNYGTVANRAAATEGYSAPNPNITPNLTAAAQRSQQLGMSGTAGAAGIINNIKPPNPVPTPNYASLIASVGGLYNAATAPKSRTATSKDYLNDNYGG